MEFKKATKTQAKGRVALHGPAGAGKTYSALAISQHLGTRIALIDTERGSASKYADRFNFDVLEVVGGYHPDRAVEAINLAGKLGYEIIILDSGTHFWNGSGGFLELVDAEVAAMKARGGKPDSFAAWKKITPIYNHFIQAILASPAHVLVTLRAKMEYAKESGDNGKTTVRKVGLAPEMRDNFQYEFDVEGMLNIEHELVIGKTRCDALDGKIFKRPGKDFADILKDWLTDGAAYVPPKPLEDLKPVSPDPLVEQANQIAKWKAALAKVETKEQVDKAAQQIASLQQWLKDAVEPDFVAAQQRVNGASA